MRKLASIIIPCYNHARFLEETVGSALASTYRPLEIIIVDDGSADESFKIARKLSTEYPEVRCIQQPNGGPAKARNEGIREAKGFYILPLDADDLISPAYLEQGIQLLETKPGVKVVYAKARKFGAVNKEWKLKPWSRKNLAMDNMIYVSAIFRKEDWQKAGGFTENTVLVREDWEFWIKMLKDEGSAVCMSFVGFFIAYTKVPGEKV